MKYFPLLFLFLFSLHANAAMLSPKIDTLPPWKVFKKMSKSELLEMAEGDKAATEIVLGKSKKQKFVGAAVTGGFAVLLGVAAAYVGSLPSVEMDSVIYLLAAIALGLAAFIFAVVAIVLLIAAFTRSRKKQYKQWSELIRSRTR